MNRGETIFSQVMDGIHREQFRRCVVRYRGDYKVQKFSCREQLLAMSFAQLTYRESLRDIEACLNSRGDQLYHLGFRSPIARSTLAEANENRDWRIYADLAQVLIRKARKLYSQEDIGFQLDEPAYAFDSTTIDLCLNLFPWARFRQRKAAVKLHTLLDLRGSIPTFIEITEGRQSDVKSLDSLWIEPGAFYVMDRGYLDFARLYTLRQASAYFVIRAKKNLRFARSYSQPFPYGSGVRSDQMGRLSGYQASRDYPETLRRIRYFDAETERFLVFLTNHFALPALVIAHLYKLRWKVGVSRQGHIVQSVKDRPRLKDSGLVAGEAPWRESKTAEPSDNMLRKECAQRTRLQRAVNADVASLHVIPVAETVDNVRKQQELTETSPIRQPSPAGYQRRHGVKEDVSTGETLSAQRRNLAGEVSAITVSGKCRHRHQGDGSGRSTGDGRAAKRARREGPGPGSTPLAKVRQG